MIVVCVGALGVFIKEIMHMTGMYEQNEICGRYACEEIGESRRKVYEVGY